MTPKRITGTQHYKNQGLKPLIVHISAKAHDALTSLAKLDQRSLQIVARSVLEQAVKEPEKTLRIISEYIRQTARED